MGISSRARMRRGDDFHEADFRVTYRDAADEGHLGRYFGPGSTRYACSSAKKIDDFTLPMRFEGELYSFHYAYGR